MATVTTDIVPILTPRVRPYILVLAEGLGPWASAVEPLAPHRSHPRAVGAMVLWPALVVEGDCRPAGPFVARSVGKEACSCNLEVEHMHRAVEVLEIFVAVRPVPVAWAGQDQMEAQRPRHQERRPGPAYEVYRTVSPPMVRTSPHRCAWTCQGISSGSGTILPSQSIVAGMNSIPIQSGIRPPSGFWSDR